MDSFYKSNRDYERAARQIEESPEISSRNKKTAKFFKESLIAQGISPGRIKKYLIIVRHFSGVVQCDFQKYTITEIQKVLVWATKRGLADWTINDYRITLKKLLRFAQGKRYDQNLNALLKADRKARNKFALTYADLLTKEEIQRLINAAHSPMFKSLISLAYETGARPSELLTLKVGSVSFAEGYSRLFLQESKTFLRTVYAMDSDRFLRAWLNLHPLRNDRDAPLFPSSYINYERKDFLLPESYNITLKRLAKKIGLKKRVYSYILRHSRITHLLEAGWNEVMIKKLVGHSVDSRAFKAYEHLAEKQVEEYILKQRHREKTERRSQGIIEEKVCTFCRTENQLDADFCVHCQRAISVKGLLQQNEKEQTLLSSMSPEIIDQLVERKVEAILKERALHLSSSRR